MSSVAVVIGSKMGIYGAGRTPPAKTHAMSGSKKTAPPDPATAHLRKNDHFDQIDEYIEEKQEFIQSEEFKQEIEGIKYQWEQKRAAQVLETKKVILQVTCEGVTLKMTITEKFLLKQASRRTPGARCLPLSLPRVPRFAALPVPSISPHPPILPPPAVPPAVYDLGG